VLLWTRLTFAAEEMRPLESRLLRFGLHLWGNPCQLFPASGRTLVNRRRTGSLRSVLCDLSNQFGHFFPSTLGPRLVQGRDVALPLLGVTSLDARVSIARSELTFKFI
jgi:hypothetical protein